MTDLPTPPEWSGGILDVLKYAVLPFTGMGTWLGVKWLIETWFTRKDKGSDTDQKRVDAAVAERDKVILSLDSRSMGYMDRLERANAKLTTDYDRAVAEKIDVMSKLLRHTDMLWAAALDQEEDAHLRKHEHCRVIQRCNSLLALVQKHLDILPLTLEVAAQVRLEKIELDPLRIPDLRTRVRTMENALPQT